MSKTAVVRPIIWALGFLILGVLAGAGTLPWGLGLLGVPLCSVLFWKYRYWPVFLFLLFFMLGAVRSVGRFDLAITEPVHRTMVGRVVDTGGLTAGGNQRVVFVGEHAMHGGQYRLMVYMRPHLPRLEMGQRVIVTGELLPLERAVNPGGYDAFLHLRSQKMDAVIWPTEIVTGDVYINFFVRMRLVRDRLAAVFDAVLPAQEAGIIRSMVLGDREDLDRDLVEIYRVAGIRHILSISGLHVTILTLAVNAVLGKFLQPRRAGLLTLGIMVLYCLMTGAAIATVRAVTMGGVLVFARVLYRDYDLITTISWACVALLIYEPLMLFNVGFQLSFSAVYGIAILSAPIERLLTLARMPAYGKFRNGLAVSMAATFSTYIIFAFHFYEIPLYSVFANVIIIPFAMVVLLLGVFTALTGLVWLPAAAIPAGVVYYILRLWEWVGRFFGALPLALVPTGGGNVPTALASAALLLAFAYVMSGFGEEIKRRLPLFLFSVAVLMACVYVQNFPPRPQTTSLYTHGEYTVARYRGSATITGTGRGGERELLRYLNRRNIRRACTLTLTEWPTPANAARLIPVMERIHELHIHAPQMHLPDALQRAADEWGVVVVFKE
ncbi:MAG: ComEC family competence protein [Defluviitaleaceae bacterium]|nr:ComEC family competence protein [Defluviitaleaceae bacterium]MCL2273452.1 ComEC family competence protein [Defluviitaleaceae bacterium]